MLNVMERTKVAFIEVLCIKLGFPDCAVFENAPRFFMSELGYLHR